MKTRPPRRSASDSAVAHIQPEGRASAESPDASPHRPPPVGSGSTVSRSISDLRSEARLALTDALEVADRGNRGRICTRLGNRRMDPEESNRADIAGRSSSTPRHQSRLSGGLAVVSAVTALEGVLARAVDAPNRRDSIGRLLDLSVKQDLVPLPLHQQLREAINARNNTVHASSASPVGRARAETLVNAIDEAVREIERRFPGSYRARY